MSPYTWAPFWLEPIQKENSCAACSRYFFWRNFKKYYNCPTLFSWPHVYNKVISKSSQLGPIIDTEHIYLFSFLHMPCITSNNLEAVENKSQLIRKLTLRHCTDFQKQENSKMNKNAYITAFLFTFCLDKTRKFY